MTDIPAPAMTSNTSAMHAHSPGVVLRSVVIGLTAFLTVVDLFAMLDEEGLETGPPPSPPADTEPMAARKHAAAERPAPDAESPAPPAPKKKSKGRGTQAKR